MPLLHTGPHAPGGIGGWAHVPGLLAALAATGVAFLVALGPLRHRWAGGAPFPWARASAFLAGLALFYSAVASPLDRVGEQYLFSAHMLQHAVLVFPVAWLLLWGLPPRLAGAVLDRPRIRRWLRWPVSPLGAFSLFTAVFYLWHVPALYEAALTSRLLHDLEHATFLATGALMWWPIVHPIRAWPRTAWGVGALYVFGLAVAQIPLFGVLTFSDRVVYSFYAEAPRLAGLLDMAPLQDQVLGGVVMKVAGMSAYATALVALFLRGGAEEGRPLAEGG